jgi:hypothetical protein
MKNFFFALIAAVFFLASAFPAHALKVVNEQVILESMDDYPLCQTRDYDGSWCNDALQRWVKTHPNDAFKAGKLTRRAMNAWGAVPFFAVAFGQKAGDCKDEDVKMAVMSALGLPADHKEVIAQAKSIVFKSCPAELEQAAADGTAESDYFLQNVCKELVAKGKLSGLRAKRCKG